MYKFNEYYIEKLQDGPVNVNFEIDFYNQFPVVNMRDVNIAQNVCELVWALKGDTNIKFLLDRNIHTRTDAAYEYFKSLNWERLHREHDDAVVAYYKLDYHVFEFDDLFQEYVVMDKDKNTIAIFNGAYFVNNNSITKEEFIQYTKCGYNLYRYDYFDNRVVNREMIYTFGNVGDVFGSLWKEQIQELIDNIRNKVNTNLTLFSRNLGSKSIYDPNISVQFNTFDLMECEIIDRWCYVNRDLFNKWTFEKENVEVLTPEEKKVCQLFTDYFYHKTITSEELVKILINEYKIPTMGINCVVTSEREDYFNETPNKLCFYGLLFYLIGHVCNAQPFTMFYNIGYAYIKDEDKEATKKLMELMEEKKVVNTEYGISFNGSIPDITNVVPVDFYIDIPYKKESVVPF